MDQLLLHYAHLLATCLALGVIMATDLRLLGKLVGYRCMIRPPRRFETRAVGAALLALCASGAGLVLYGLDQSPDYLDNPKLQAKLALVGLLCANAFVLHRLTFPRLSRVRAVSVWSLRDRFALALPVALSNTLWMYCAFLGVARPWNHTRTLTEVLLPAAALFVLLALLILAALHVASRDEARTPPDWIDSMKARLSERAPLGAYRHPFENSVHDSAH
jgi:hypothetical protein